MIDEDDARPTTKRDLIEGNLDRAADKEQSRALTISAGKNAVTFENMLDVMQFAKLMATAQQAVPPHLRGNPGACLAITMQANEWNMSPFQVANKSYIANDRVAYESQLIHAVVESRAPLKTRLKARYEGNIKDGSRKIIVFGTLKGEVDPLEYESPTLAELIKLRGRNERGQVKGSPLWDADPDQQLWYYGTRAWARKWTPDVIMGIYAVDELPEEYGAERARDVTSLAERLAAPREDQNEGFRPDTPEDTETINGALAEAGHQPKAAAEQKVGLQVSAAAQAVAEAADASPPPEPEKKRRRAAKDKEPQAPSEPPHADPREAQDAPAAPAAPETAPQADASPAAAQAAPEPAGTPAEECGMAEPSHKAREAPIDTYAAYAADADKIKTPEEYTAYAEKWMRLAPDHAHRHARWEREKPRRQTLGVMGDNLAKLIKLGKELRAKEEGK